MSRDFNIDKFIKNRDKFGDQPKLRRTESNSQPNRVVRSETKEEANKQSRGFMARKARFRRFRNQQNYNRSQQQNRSNALQLQQKPVQQEQQSIPHRVEQQITQINPIDYQNIYVQPQQADINEPPNFLEEVEGDGFSIDPREQFKFELKASKKESFFRFKRFVSRLETYMEISPYWKSMFNIFTIVFAFSTVVFNVILLINNFGRLRTEVPFFYNTQLSKWVNEDKSFFFLFIIMSIIANLMVTRFSMTIYNFDKKLVYVMSASLILANILLTISFMQLLSFVLI